MKRKTKKKFFVRSFLPFVWLKSSNLAYIAEIVDGDKKLITSLFHFTILRFFPLSQAILWLNLNYGLWFLTFNSLLAEEFSSLFQVFIFRVMKQKY